MASVTPPEGGTTAAGASRPRFRGRDEAGAAHNRLSRPGVSFLQQGRREPGRGVIALAEGHAYLRSVIAPNPPPRRNAGLPDCLRACFALLALLVAAGTVLLGGPAAVRSTGPVYACTGITTVASLTAPKAARPAASITRDESSIEAADIEVPAEFGLLAPHRVAVRVRRTAAIAYAEPAGPPSPPIGRGSPHRPPRAA
ncbi:hypothetical protein Q8W71_05270 [Methylobacterium sp. NEAU 140]|uniref:hypothetical protein n=1 Tax=Methylobacterium sp. NEAU 140 TaxID=3064945 RepID=UPI002736B57F|nr:hypothetical protein [Methylobacterium sp. NEAU 140]MDP4022023.1 hypothetical protein [Methylobacterium sp. NEAU 140]